MSQINYETAWRLLRLTIAPLYGYSVDLEVVGDWMDGIIQAMEEQDQRP